MTDPGYHELDDGSEDLARFASDEAGRSVKL
jgi:hypothetical protein